MIGVYGGSFDPPHLGHLHLINQILRQFSFDTFYVVPAYQNPLKTQEPQILPKDRLELLNLALSDVPQNNVAVLEWEIRQNKPSYTIDTIRHLQALHPGESFTFVLGEDAFLRLPEWKSAQELVKMLDWIVVFRGSQKVSFSSQFLEKLHISDSHWQSDSVLAYCQNQRSIRLVNIDALPCSSSDLRRQIQDLWKKNELATTPAGIQRSVWQLIKEKRLYSVNEMTEI